MGNKRGGASLEREVAVDEDIGGAGCGELCLGYGVRIDAAAEAVREKRMQALPRDVICTGPN